MFVIVAAKADHYVVITALHREAPPGRIRDHLAQHYGHLRHRTSEHTPAGGSQG
ncbi:hypothetical protein [Streptomyces sp. NPDC002588]|uniref:hypothetical protein n=1 Tax=Streptomyces sp. NPDC002588 TaxID=3154419 RepID=UPI0033340BEC